MQDLRSRFPNEQIIIRHYTCSLNILKRNTGQIRTEHERTRGLSRDGNRLRGF